MPVMRICFNTVGSQSDLPEKRWDSCTPVETVVSNILAMLDSDRARVRQTLMKMALSDNEPSSRAVLESILALTSLYRDGHQYYAARRKLSALRALLASTEKGISAKGGIQHIAAGILLCTFEVRTNTLSILYAAHRSIQLQQTTETNSQWVGHVCGAKDVIRAVQSERYSPDSDASIILGWVYYYDTLARFTLRHWRTDLVKQTAASLGFNAMGSTSCALQYMIARTSFVRQIPSISGHSHPLLLLLSEVFGATLYPWNPRYHTDEYQEYIDGLESRLKNLSLTGLGAGTALSVVTEDLDQVLELFRLAGLVYLERISKNFSGQSRKLDTWTEKAFLIFNKLDTCRNTFPLFVFGCEARTDDRRMMILKLIAKTERNPHLRNLLDTKVLIQSAWIQDDLQVDGEVEYIQKLGLVLSTSDAIPNFV